MALEAIVGPDGRIWWATFGFPGTMNDLNILDRSPLVGDILDGRLECEPYHINGEVQGVLPVNRWDIPSLELFCTVVQTA